MPDNPLDNISLKKEDNPLDAISLKKKDSSDSNGSQLNLNESQQASQSQSGSLQAGTNGQGTDGQIGFSTVARPGDKPNVQYDEQQPEMFTDQHAQLNQPIKPPKTKQQQTQDKIVQKAKDNWSKSGTFKDYPTPDEKINNLNSAKDAIDAKYQDLITKAPNQDEAKKLLEDYQKELDETAIKNGLDKVGNRYVVPKADVDKYSKHLSDAINEVQQEEGLKDKSWLKSAYYALSAGAAGVDASVARVLEATIPFAKNLGWGDYFQKGEKEMAQKAKYYDDDISANIAEGNWGSAIGHATLNVIEQAPLLATIAAGNEAGIGQATIGGLGLGEGIKKYEDIKDIDVPNSAKMFNAIMTTMNFMAVGELGGRNVIENAKNLVAQTGEQQAKQLLEKSYQSTLQNSVETLYKATSPALKGYAIGAGTQLSNNIVEKATINPNKDITEGVNDAGLTWALLDKAMTIHGDINNAQTAIDAARGKVPRNIPFEDQARAVGLVLEKDHLLGSNEKLDESFQEVNNKRIDDIKNKINFIVEPRVNKEKVSILNNEINIELAKEKPDIEQIGKLQNELNGLEPKKAFPEDEQLKSLLKERDGLDPVEGKTRQAEIDKELIPILKSRQKLKQQFFDETIKGIDDPIDQDMYKEEKQQAKDELKDVLSSSRSQENDQKFSQMESDLKEIDNSIQQLKSENPDQFKKDGTPKANSKLLGNYKGLVDTRSSIAEEMGKLKDATFQKRAKAESEKSRVETENINKAFEERQKELEKNIPEGDLAEEKNSQKINNIFDKVSNEEKPTKEEIDFVNENAYLPKGYKFGEKGLEKSEKEPDSIDEYIPGETEKVTNLVTDPETFQYKPDSDMETGKTKGTEASLPTEKNPVSVWENPETGEKTVIEGHNKFNAAKEAGMDEVPVKNIKANTKEEALAKAALENVKKGEMSGITKTDKGYKIDKTGTEFDENGKLLTKPTIETKAEDNVKPYDDPEMTKIANLVNDSYIKGEYGEKALANIMSKISDAKTKEIYENMLGKMRKGEIFSEDVRNRVTKQGHGSAEDQAALVYDLAELKAKKYDIQNKINEATDPETIKSLQEDLLYNDRDIMDNAVANRMIGRDWGQLGQIRQVWVDKDANILDMVDQYKAAKGIKELTPQQEKEIRDNFNKFNTLEKKIKDLEKENVRLNKEKEILDTLLEEAKKQKRADRSLKASDAISKSKERIAQSKDRLKKLVLGQLSAGIDPRIAVEIGKIAKEKVYQGIVKFDELVKNVWDEVKEYFPDWSEKDVREHMAYSPDSVPRTDESKTFSTLKKTAQIKEKTEKGDFSTPKKRIYDESDELKSARKEYANARFEWDQARRRDMMKNRPIGEKIADNILRWQRFSVLLYPTTMLKLAAVVGHSMVTKPIMSAMQELAYRFTPKGISDKAALWGHVNISALGKYYSGFIRNFALSNLKEHFLGIDAKEAMYGKPHTYDEWTLGSGLLEMPGRTHGYIKSFIKNSEFEFAHENIWQNYLRRADDINKKLQSKKLSDSERKRLEGEYKDVDLTKEDITEKINKLSVEHGKWSILMNNNHVVDKLRGLMEGTGAVGWFLKSEYPIIKIPLNYVDRAIGIKYGLVNAFLGKRGLAVKGLIKESPGLFEMMFKGTKGLTQPQSEILQRSIVLGSMGATFFGMGFLMRNQMKKNDDGSYQLFDNRIDKNLIHLPLYESIFSGMETGQKLDQRKKDGKEVNTESFIKDFLMTDIDIIKKMPFTQQLQYGFTGKFVKAIFDKSKDDEKVRTKIGDALSQKIVDMVDPGFLKQWANWQDTPGENFKEWLKNKPTPRRPEGLKETFEVGLPYVRKNVPTVDQYKSNIRVKEFQKKHDPGAITGKGMFDKTTVANYTEAENKFNKFQSDIMEKEWKKIPAGDDREYKFEQFIKKNHLEKEYVWHKERFKYRDKETTNNAQVKKLQNAIEELSSVTDKYDKRDYTEAISQDMKEMVRAYNKKEQFIVSDLTEKMAEEYGKKPTEKAKETKDISNDLE
jgi:hypothetical protein